MCPNGSFSKCRGNPTFANGSGCNILPHLNCCRARQHRHDRHLQPQHVQLLHQPNHFSGATSSCSVHVNPHEWISWLATPNQSVLHETNHKLGQATPPLFYPPCNLVGREAKFKTPPQKLPKAPLSEPSPPSRRVFNLLSFSFSACIFLLVFGPMASLPQAKTKTTHCASILRDPRL